MWCGVIRDATKRRRLPVLTFDFEDFRATRPAKGAWELVIDEGRYRQATS